MFSKRSVEDLNCYQIVKYFQNLITKNNDIINNASLETYSFKKSFGERLLAFFNIFLAATLLSSFILYSSADKKKKIIVMSVIVILTLMVLLIYCISVGIKFSEQYKRQRIYREINMEIQIILANVSAFFTPSFYHLHTMISMATLQQFVDVIKAICKERNRQHNNFFKLISRDWRTLFVTLLCVITFLTIATVVLVLCFCGVIQ